MTDPRQLRPSDLCRLLNSIPLGEVIDEQRLRHHRSSAGLRIGSQRRVDLVKYVAWLVQQRHTPKPGPTSKLVPPPSLAEAAEGAAAVGTAAAGTRQNQVGGHGQKFAGKQEALIAALLTEPSYPAAAAKVGVGKTTLYRWLQNPDFRRAYRRARRELVESAIGRIQAATGQAVDALLMVAFQGRRESDRVRAAVALLDHALRGLDHGDALHGAPDPQSASRMGTTEVVELLGNQLRQLEQSELPTAEKSRLTATLCDALLRALGVDVLDKRFEALQSVLLERKEKAR